MAALNHRRRSIVHPLYDLRESQKAARRNNVTAGLRSIVPRSHKRTFYPLPAGTSYCQRCALNIVISVLVRCCLTLVICTAATMAIPGTRYKYRLFCHRSRNAGSSLTKDTRSTLKLITIIIRLPIRKFEELV